MVITEELGYDIRSTSRKQNQPPKWKTRLEYQISNWRCNISCLEHLKKVGTLRNAKTIQWLIKKYHLETKTTAEVIEELKQRVLATSNKIERYEARIKQYRQNRQFNSNQRRFYQSLDDDNNTTGVPDKEESTKFWQNSGKISGTIQRIITPMQLGLHLQNLSWVNVPWMTLLSLLT